VVNLGILEFHLSIVFFLTEYIAKPFHERYKYLIIISALGGLQIPSMEPLGPSGRIGKFLVRFYTTVAYLFILAYPLLNLVHLLFMASNMYDAILDLMVISSGLHAGTRMSIFLWKRKEFTDLFNTWDKHFCRPNDKNVELREVRDHIVSAGARE